MQYLDGYRKALIVPVAALSASGRGCVKTLGDRRVQPKAGSAVALSWTSASFVPFRGTEHDDTALRAEFSQSLGPLRTLTTTRELCDAARRRTHLMTDTGRRGFALKHDGSANAAHHMHWQDFLRTSVVILGKAEMQFADRHGLASRCADGASSFGGGGDGVRCRRGQNPTR